MNTRSARINAKEREKKERQARKGKDRGTEGESPTLSRSNDALIGDEEQNEKEKKEEIEANREGI